MNSMDRKPIYLGGRNNGWRELSTLCIYIHILIIYVDENKEIKINIYHVIVMIFY